VIASFKDPETRKLWETGQSRKIPAQLQKTAVRKLGFLQFASRLIDLRIPAGNRLEALKGERKGQFSIRINDRYRICFVWRDEKAHDVEIVDYH
jgi:proteic killer suppression protein